VRVDAAVRQWPGGVVRAEADATHHALPAVPVVKRAEIQPAELVGVLSTDDREVVGEHLDQVFASVIGLSAPRAVTVADSELNEVVVAIRHVADAELVLPVNAAAGGGLWRIVVLLPVISAAIEVVEYRRPDRVIPAAAEHVGVKRGIVVVHEIARQSDRPVGARLLRRSVVAPITGDAAFWGEAVIGLQADLGVRT